MYLEFDLVSEIIFRPNTSRSNANTLIVTADRIARLLKTSGATQAIVLDISKAFYRVCHTGLLYKFRWCGVMEMCVIWLSHFVVVKDFEWFWSASHLLSVNAGIPHNFLSHTSLWMNERKLYKAVWETASFIYRLTKSIKAIF